LSAIGTLAKIAPPRWKVALLSAMLSESLPWSITAFSRDLLRRNRILLTFKAIEKPSGNGNSAELNSPVDPTLERDVALLKNRHLCSLHQGGHDAPVTVIFTRTTCFFNGSFARERFFAFRAAGPSKQESESYRWVLIMTMLQLTPEDRVAFCKDIVRLTFLKPSVKKKCQQRKRQPELQDPTDHQDPEVLRMRVRGK
jgi:hypothetical protein